MPAERRVAFYAPLKPPDHPVPSGDRRMARLLIAALGRAGFDPALASRFRSMDAGGDPARQARIERVGRRLGRRFAARAGPAPRAWLTYHLHYKAPDWLGPEASHALGIPYFLAEASFAPKRSGGPWDRNHRGVAEAVAAARAIFCINPNDVACLLPLVADPAVLVPLPPFLDPGPYRAAAGERLRHRREIAQRLGLPAERPWLLAVAMMRHGDKLASYRLLAETMRRLEDGAAILILVGDGPAEAEVRLAFVPVAARVRMLGRLPEWALPPLYAAADLLVWPAVREAYGMALLEAQATGLPVVAGRIGGVPAVVEDGETGLLAAPEDPQALADAVATLIEEPERRAEMRRAALSRIARRHSLDRAAAVLRQSISPWLPC